MSTDLRRINNRALLLAVALAALSFAQASRLTAEARQTEQSLSALSAANDQASARRAEASLEARASLEAVYAERDDLEASAAEPVAVGERWLSVSLADRAVTLFVDGEAKMTAGVAVGMGNDPNAGAWARPFSTPRGRRSIVGLVEEPVWIPPDWHYAEQSHVTGLPVVAVSEGQAYEVGDGSTVEVRGGSVGLVKDGEFTAYASGTNIVAGGAVIQPPVSSSQRRYKYVLGKHMIDIGQGYAFHGTDKPWSVGQAASHGCMRMKTDEIAALFAQVEVGDPVFIY